MNILYVGPVGCDGTSLQRLNALRSLGHDVDSVCSFVYTQRSKLGLIRVLGRFFIRPFVGIRINFQIRQRLCKKKYDVLWIDKGLLVYPSTLRFARRSDDSLKLVSYSPDDMMNENNQSRFYLSGVSIYHAHVTTKSYNVDELVDIGASKVVFVGNAYDPSVHRPVAVGYEDDNIVFADVGFIGAYEAERVRSMDFLAQHGVDVIFRCPSWPKTVTRPKYLKIVEGYLAADHYAKQICAFKINLAFLRKVNRDLQTTRSVEIPACCSFMLAEDTDEHRSMFEAGVEADYFRDDEELLSKVKQYLDDENLRRSMADAGLRRCLSSGYSNHARLGGVLKQI